MKIYIKTSIILLVSSFLLANPPTDTQKVSLTVKIEKIRSDKGFIRIVMFNNKDGFPGNHQKSVLAKSCEIKNNTATLVINDLPKGTYAIAAFHDENNNNNFDFSLIGIPKEGYGASNNAKATFGPPSFNDAKFEVYQDKQISFLLTYW
jgi:uncharacterized protein (DUF2141 family)